jgi:hypothetical protein
MPSQSSAHKIETVSIVEITVNDPEPIERVTGPGGDEWRSHLYDLRTEQDVLDHWAANAIRNGVRDVSELDGWADVPAGTVTMTVVDVYPFPF